MSEKRLKLNRIMGGITFLLMLVSLYSIFIYAPAEEQMGIVQKIFYFHVPSAWIAFLAFFIVFVCSILYLWKRESRWDMMAHSSAEIGTLFTSLVLITGPIWGKPVWGVWWTWDSRLTTTLILWFIYVAYLMIRKYGGEESKKARFAAVLGIIGFFDIPIIYMSVLWWRTIHPLPVVLSPGGFGKGLSPEMLSTLLISFAAFTFLFFYLLRLRIGTERMEDDLRYIKERAFNK